MMLGLLTGCASTASVENELASHVGKPVQTAFKTMGKPTKVYNLQDGTWHYLWTRASKLIKSGGTSFMGVPLSTASQRECTRVLIVDKQKQVIGYDMEGAC
jgi:hypothetical protein